MERACQPPLDQSFELNQIKLLMSSQHAVTSLDTRGLVILDHTLVDRGENDISFVGILDRSKPVFLCCQINVCRGGGLIITKSKQCVIEWTRLALRIKNSRLQLLLNIQETIK